MTRISHAEFQQALSDLSSDPGAIQYGVQDGGTLAPVSRLPAPSIPGSRRLTRALPRVAGALPVIGQAIDSVCIAYSLAPETTVRALRRSTVGFVADRIWNNATQNTLQRMCRDTPGYTPPSPSPPFTGGQCPGVRYTITVSMNVLSGINCDVPSIYSFSEDVKGEITAFRVIPSTASTGAARGSVEVFARGLGDTLSDPLRWIGLDSRQNFGSCRGGPTPTINSITIVRADGLPDTCGSVPPEYRDGGSPVFAPSLDIDIAPNVPLNIAPNVSANANGTVNISLPPLGDVSVDFGGIDVRFNPTPSDPNAPEPQPETPQPEIPPTRPDPGDTEPDPTNPPPAPPVDEPPLEEPVEKSPQVIRAALVTVSTISPTATTIFQTSNPNVYAPDLGLIAFRCRASENASGWTEDIRIKNRRQFVTCPWEGGAFDVRGTPRPGVVWNITPVYDLSSIPAQPST